MPFTLGRPVTEAKADLFKALAHPARVRVLELLAEREHTIGELAELSGMELSHLSQQVTDNLKEFFGDKLLKTTIPRNIRLAEAPSHGKPVQMYDPRSKGAEAYTALALELLRRNGVASRKTKAPDSASSTGPRFWPYNK